MEKARRHRVHIHGGSFAELNPEGGRPFNTTVMIDAHGTIVTRYRKLHTFDVTLPDGTGWSIGRCRRGRSLSIEEL